MWKCVKCKTNNSYPLGYNSANEFEYKCHDCGQIFINLEFEK